jgi:3,4-dihydroxy-2-butanone 4-phosphate synthase
MTYQNTTRQEVTITEGQEYMISVNGRPVYTGIADSDTEAQERLESYALYISAANNSVTPIKIRIVPL